MNREITLVERTIYLGMNRNICSGQSYQMHLLIHSNLPLPTKAIHLFYPSGIR